MFLTDFLTIFLTNNLTKFFDEFFDESFDKLFDKYLNLLTNFLTDFLTCSLLAIASLRIGVPSILLQGNNWYFAALAIMFLCYFLYALFITETFRKRLHNNDLTGLVMRMARIKEN